MDKKTGIEKAMLAEGWLTTEERQFLFDSVARLDDTGYVVNIGVEYGASVICFAEGNKIVPIDCFDIDMSKWPYGDMYGVRVNLFEDDSYSIVRMYIGHDIKEYIDVLFVDGDHSYEGVRKDIAWVMFVNLKGIVMFHDCYDWLTLPEKVPHQVCPGVNQAVQEWVDGKAFEGWQELSHVGTMRVFKRVE